ncbi:chromosome segregation ATPase [Phyllobacterium trifolii]|uniref:Chromosome segregation ATPase n=1 Tax=Phyllobacterium trifolii TaxID=300193 RepID=A0A839U2L7_9HYPH|nr:hypothetical protein [Phyllobacterium trifolii]MBB3144888.1 chromosome segregation ATPase [Phyllobacterium trifolii]
MSKAAATDLIIKLPAVMTAETFTNDEEFEKLYSAVKEAVSKHVPDTSTKTGRDAVKSLAYKVAQTKVALVKQGKALTEGWRNQTTKVNAACNTIEERLDALRDEVRKPVDDWEKIEEDRVDAHKEKLQSLIDLSKVGLGRTVAEYRELLATAEQTQLGATWEEFAAQASLAREDAIETLTRMLKIAEKQEADAAELEKLRAKDAEREAADAERLAAENAAKAEAEQAEARKVEDERIANEARQKALDEAAERVADAERKAAKADADAKQAIADAAAKVEDDRRKAADEQAAAEAEQKRRDDDKAHRQTVNRAIVSELVDCSDITADQAQQIVIAIVSGLVPNVTLKY